MKKSFLLNIILVAAASTVSAQSVPGSWRVLPMQGTSITDIVEIPSAVYYISAHHPEYGYDNTLLFIDKESDESGVVVPGERISDGGVSILRYNPEGKYLLCGYTNGNIDLIYDSGKVVNLPEIKESRVNGSKTISDIFFKDNRIYVATQFGIVIFDDREHVVKESGLFDKPVSKIGVMGNRLLIYGLIDADNPTVQTLMEAPIDGRHNSLDRFSVLRSNVSINDWIIPGDNYYITIGGSDTSATLIKVEIADNGDFTFTNIVNVPGASKIKVCDTGYYCAGTGTIAILDKEGNLASSKNIDSNYISSTAGLWNSNMKSVWNSNGNSIGCYDMSQSAPVTIKEPFEAEGSRTFNNAYMTNSVDGKAYINGIGTTQYHPGGDTWGLHYPFLLESYDWNTGELEHAYPELSKQYSSGSQAEQNKFKVNALFGGQAATVVDPVDPSLIYHANQLEGLMLIRDRKIVYRFYAVNSPIESWWMYRVTDLAFDNMGNLWIGLWRYDSESATSTKGVYKVLPKESLELARTNPAALSEKDGSGQYKYWQQPKWTDSDHGNVDMHLAFSGNKGLKIDGSWQEELTGIDTKGTSDVSDDSYVKYNGYMDQDGNVSNPSLQGAIAVDKKGWFWIGTNAGIYVIKDIDQIGNPSSYLSAVRPKVAREDGTNYADYLLASEKIYGIGVDANNNKWIATSNSGLYHVNEDGSKIIEILDKTNSPLRTNEITSVICNPDGNDVLVGTVHGLYVYGSTSSPAAPDFSDVKVYPNPVRPDYGGWVTIEGLMANSLVKIADAAGNVLWNGRAEGGTCQWDVCDASGKKVRSGVYYVFASQTENDGSAGAVSKIVVIN